MRVDFLQFELAKELAEKYGTPLLVLSKSKLTANYRGLKQSMPSVEPFYAVKANDNIDILRMINELGGSFDVASVGEFELVKGVGVDNRRILYTHPIKTEEDIRYFFEQGLTLFVFDNEDELHKIKRNAPGASVLLRIAVSNPFCMVNLNYKFGADPQSAEELLDKATALGLRVSGISFHVGSQSLNPYVYVESIVICKRIYDFMALKGVKMRLLDIGGGFPIQYIENVMPIQKFCEPINDALNNYFSDTTILAEPGRVISGDAVVLVTKVVGKSYRNNARWYYIDDGLYNSFSGKVYDHANYRIVSERKDGMMRCVLAGPTCDSFDVISNDVILPELEVGDMLLAPSMGAYTNASATAFNRLEKAHTITID
jgi:ornithine decarboxylase